MKNNRLPLITVMSLGLLASLSAFATSWGQNNTYYIKFNFSCVAFGKQVASVSAHSGIKQFNRYETNGHPFWGDIHDVSLQRIGKLGDSNCYYIGKAVIQGTASDGLSDQGPVVQYFLTYDDESAFHTIEVAIPITREDSFSRDGQSDRIALQQSIDSTDLSRDQSNSPTSAVKLSVSYAN